MKLTVTYYPPTESGITAKVWRSDGDWTNVELIAKDGETVEQAIALIQSELPEWVAIELTVTLVRAIPIHAKG